MIAKHVRLSLWLLALLPIVNGCGRTTAPVSLESAGSQDALNSRGIKNGSLAGSDFAAVVRLEINNITLCTGTLISPRLVLTAAHCLRNATPGSVKLRLSNGSLLAASAFRTHSFYRTYSEVAAITVNGTSIRYLTSVSDLAVISFKSNVGLGSYSLAAALPSLASPVTIVGYGRDSSETNGVKRVGTAKNFGYASVPYTKDPFAPRLGGNIVFGPGPALACVGDSGGPAFTTDRKIFGVFSMYAALNSQTCANTISNTYIDVVEPFNRTFIDKALLEM